MKYASTIAPGAVSGSESEAPKPVARKRMLFLCPFYPPDQGAGGPLYGMLCEDLAAHGWRVSVVAAVPHYPSGQVASDYRGRLLQRESRNGVDVIRVWIPSGNRANLWWRLITQLIYQMLAVIAGLRCGYDYVLAVNPALSVGLPFLMLSVLRKRPAIYAVQDIYPDVGVKLGIFRNRFVIAAVSFLENFCLRQAKVVQVISEGFRARYLAAGLPSQKIAVVPNWIDTDWMRPMPRPVEFAERFGLNGYFTAMYAGNIGVSQGLETVLEAAKLLRSERSLRFVLVGEGTGLRRLQELVERDEIDNVQFVPYQPWEAVPRMLACADVAIVSLKRGVGSESVPSKCNSLLGCGRAIVASVDRNCDTWNLVEQSGAGLCVEPEDPQQLAQAILHLYRDPELRRECERNGRCYAVRHLSRKVAVKSFVDLFEPMVDARRRLKS